MNPLYDDWIAWPLAKIIEFANHLADEVGLNAEERGGLAESMWREAGFGPWNVQGPKPRYINYPRVLPKTGSVDDPNWLEMAALHNAPRVASSELVESKADLPALRWEQRGEGLAARHVLMNGPFQNDHRRKRQADPFRMEAGRICETAAVILWRKGYYRIDRFDRQWIGPHGMSEPYKGLFWYYDRLTRWSRAADHFARSSTKEARQRGLYCALRLGQTFTEMEVVAEHNEFFQRQSGIYNRQVDYASGRRQGQSDEDRRAAWWKYRRQGLLPTAAGEAAGQELGRSEITIRRAFNFAYPEWDGS